MKSLPKTAEPRSAQHTVLLVGATGRTGRRVLAQLLGRGIPVRAIVRSKSRLPEGASGHPLLTVIEADLLSLSTEELQRHLDGCGTVISCLGHTTDVRGILGPPRDLVVRALTNLCHAVAAMRPAEPTRFILMSSVSVNQPAKADSRRGAGERAFIGALRGLVPPTRDNQRAADLLARGLAAGEGAGSVEWVVVRPDTLREGEVSEYRLSDELVNSIFRPGETNMANVAHFMCELTTDAAMWRRWKGKMPVIVNR